MKNNKGFTLVELGVSISLVTIVALLLFQIVASVKKMYSESDLQTTLLTKQGIIVKKIQDDLNNNSVSSITYCQNNLSNSCLEFAFIGSTIKKQLIVNPIERKITYDNYTIDYFKIDEDITFGNLVFNSTTDFFTIKIPITRNNLEGNYDINITSLANRIYNLGSVGEMSLTLSNNNVIPIISSGANYWMAIYQNDAEWIKTFGEKYMRFLKIDTCSNSSLTGNVYEFKTDTARWCQSTNFYTQKAKVDEAGYIEGTKSGSLDKGNYEETISNTLNSNIVYIKMNEYMNRYTFKSR